MKDNGKMQIKAGVILGYANFAVKMVIQLAYVPILLRLLGQNEYGVYQLVASVISYLSLLNFGFGGSYLRFYAIFKGDKKKEDTLNGTFLSVFLFFAVIAFGVGMLMTWNTELLLGDKLLHSEIKLAQVLMFIMAINMALSFPISVFSSIVTSRECFIFQRVVELLKSIFNPFLVIIALLMGYGSIGLVCVATLLTIAGAVANIWYVLKKIKAGFIFTSIDKGLIKEVGVFSFFLFLNSIIDQINWNVDKFLLGRFVGAASIAIYSVGAQINNIYIQITDMIATVMAPRVNIITASEKNPLPKLSNLWIKVGRLQTILVLGILAGFSVFGKEFINLWAGPEYMESYYVTLLLIAPISIPLCQTLGVDIQRALNKHKYRSIVYACVAIGNLIISIPLIKNFGAVGAAAGTMVALIVGNVIIMNIMYDKLIGLDVRGFWKQVCKLVPSVIPAIIVSILLNNVIRIDSWGLLIVGCSIFGLVYFICLNIYGFNKEEKAMVNHMMIGVLSNLCHFFGQHKK